MSADTIGEITRILDDMLAKIPTERNYNAEFGRVAEILLREHSVAIPALDLRLKFTLLMQDEFSAIPREEWKISDMEWLAQMEQVTKQKFLQWIEEQIKEKGD